MRRWIDTAILLAAGLAAGEIALILGLPMPFMLGGLTGAALAVFAIERREGPKDLRLPPKFRFFFVAVIGAMIGAGFSPALLALMPGFWPSMLAILPFIVVSHLGGYIIMRRIGGYPRVDALYASMPGGLLEAIELGTRAGADPRVLAVQHFIRIVLVVVSVPLLFWVVTGEVVGSATGIRFAAGVYDWGDLALIFALAVLGLFLGSGLNIPAGHLMGPLFLVAALQVTGVVTLAAPGWLMDVAQWIVGVGLGAQFSGLKSGVLVRGLWVGVLAVGYMLAVSFAFALLFAELVPGSLPTLFLSFAPGGVTEMNLIALSLALSPVVVAVHHLVRIVATVVVTFALARVTGIGQAP